MLKNIYCIYIYTYYKTALVTNRCKCIGWKTQYICFLLNFLLAKRCYISYHIISYALCKSFWQHLFPLPLGDELQRPVLSTQLMTLLIMVLVMRWQIQGARASFTMFSKDCGTSMQHFYKFLVTVQIFAVHINYHNYDFNYLFA